ncbi:MAG TPA: ABC transporter permease [Vicinamibacterales bacterium]|nr:ABC transporter permease [Vicinamibacterales bacterium]
MTALLFDLRHAARVFVKQGSATAVAAFTLALAIGATTAIFSVVHGVLLRPLPYPDSDRILAIWEVNHRGTYSRLADPNFNDFRDRNHTFTTMAKYQSGVTSVVARGEPTRTAVATVTRDFFSVLGTQPATGRRFGDADARIGAPPTAVVSHRYWQQSLGSTATLSELQVRIENRLHDVIGVMPRGFDFPGDVDVWVPAELDAENTSRTSHNFRAIGRLRDRVRVETARADLSAIAQDVIRQSPEQGDYLMADATAVPLLTSLTGRVSSTLYVLLGAVLFLLLIACANVTNLLLAQAAARRRELAVRHALGAGRGRLIRQFVVESAALVAVGGAAGLLIASLGVRALLALAPADLPRQDEVSMSGPVLGFAIALSALVAVGLGLVTALRASSRDPRASLVDGGRGQAGGAASQRVGRVIVAAQMALTVVLLVGAALLGRSLLEVLSVNPGFRTDGVVAVDLARPYSDDPAAKARLAPFYGDVFDGLRTIPGVQQVAAVNAVPLDGGLPDGLFLVMTPQEMPANPDDLWPMYEQKEKLGTADYCAASPDYFRALGIPLVRGRLFDDRDGPDAPHAALITESLARTRWPDIDPIGRTIQFGNMDGDTRLLTIVGIVGDTRESGLEQPPRPTVYVNLLQRPRFSATVVVRSDADPTTIMASARAVLKQVAPDVPPRFRTFAQIYDASLGARRFNLTLVAVFAGTALALAVAGIYGVMAYSVTERRKEIGVRVALGASPRQVFQMVIGQGLLTTTIGVVAGIAAASGLTRTIQSLLFGVTPTDPLTFASVVAALMIVAVIACYVPARRATESDPVEALRME